MTARVFNAPTNRKASTPGPEKILQYVVEHSLARTFGKRHYIRKTHPDAFEGPGKPDLVGHIYGVHVEIELKVSNNRPTPEQAAELRRLFETGALGFLLLHHQAEEAYFLIPACSVENFSYRERGGWIHLPHWGDGKDRRLNLTPLGHIVVTHGLQLQQRFERHEK